MKLYNTMTRKVEELTPIKPPTVTMYTCGPTVYDDPHIGNWRTFVLYDTLHRTLQAAGYTVEHVLNITDVGHLTSDDDEGDDKLQKRAAERRKTAWELADYYRERFVQGMQQLAIITPAYMPRATELINEQIAMVQHLEERGYTYQIDDGIYFDTSKLSDYGKLARLDPESLKAGARVTYNEQKRQPTDFALWKFSKPDEQRDMEWESPWGVGFPGWHLECSVMAEKYLGATIDIHAGGIDHIPVHHTNEIAQSESAHDAPFAHIWVHTEFIRVNDEKISKSLGNGITLDNIREQGYLVRALRIMYLQSHYKTTANFSWETLQAAQNRLISLQAVADLRFQYTNKKTEDEAELLVRTRQAIVDAMSNDLNSPQALSALAELEDQLSDGLAKSSASAFEKLVQVVDQYFGLRLLASEDISPEQKSLIRQRQAARVKQDFTTADNLRNQLSQQGLEILDTANGPLWRRVILEQ
jgi:cysteinyl-tRNA synthetase